MQRAVDSTRPPDGAPMRVLLVSHALPPHLGGIEIVVEEEAEALSRLGLEITVVTSSWCQPGEVPTRWTKRTVPALNLLEKRFGVPFPLFGPSLLTTMFRAVRRADVVHIHDVFYLSSFAAGVTALFLGKPVVLTQHVDLVPHPSRLVEGVQRTVFLSYGRLLFSRSSRVLVLNDRVRDFVAARGATPEKIEFLPNGVDVEAFRPATGGEGARLRVGLGLPQNRILVLFVGRPVAKKGFDILAECASPDYDLVFVGGESRPVEIGRAGGRIYYLGTVPRVKMQEIYRAVDVFCLPSQGEGFPLTVQEAMASGLPVVTTDDEAYRPYEVPSDAICFVSPNQTELGRELRQLSDDAALRAELGCRAREYACSQFSWDVHATRLERLYQQVRAARAANQAQRTGRILRKWN